MLSGFKNYRSFLGLSDNFHKKRLVNPNAGEIHELMTLLCSRAVEYELVETEDGNYFFVTEDSVVPHSGYTHHSVVQSAQGRAGYHSFLGVHELSSGESEPTAFGFLICPLSVKNDPTFSKILRNLIAKSDHGKNEVFIKIIGHSSYSKALANGHTAQELFNDTIQLAGNNWAGLDIALDIVSTAYQEVWSLPKWIPEYSSPLCPYCRSKEPDRN